MSTTTSTVVIGGAQGIGAQVARTLSGDDELVIADIQADAAAEVAASLPNARAVGVDITDSASIARLVADTPTATRVAIVAGAFSAGPSVEVEAAEFSRILAINLVGVFDSARQYSASMLERGGGSIVAITSIAARMPRMRQAAYSASKAGMRQALRVLGMEVLPQGVRINFVAPGPTRTPMMDQLAADHPDVHLWDGELETGRPRILDGRVAEPEDVANAVKFLLSPEAGHIALHDLYVDGAESLGM